VWFIFDSLLHIEDFNFKIPGLCHIVVVFRHLDFYAVFVGGSSWIPLTLENGSDRLSRNIGQLLPTSSV
jgi:hypothetical protein